MISEVGFVDFDDFGQYYSDSSSQSDKLDADLHELIFSHEHSSSFMRRATVQIETSTSDRKTNDVFLTMSKVGGSGGVGVEVEWGDEKGPSWSVRGHGEIHDNKGYRIEGEIKRDYDGNGKAGIYVEKEK